LYNSADKEQNVDLTGKTAIVTGSGRGIGREIALKLAEVGANVVVNDFGIPEPANETVEQIKKLQRQSMVAMGDISQAVDVNRIVDMTVAAYGKLDILVNNAGITRDQLLIRMTDDDWDKVLTVDLKSVFLCTRSALRHMIRQRSGRIISISSIVGIIGNAGQANYASAKAGIIGFTKATAKEVASRNITVNAVAPGFIDTAMTQQLPEERRQEMANKIPAGYLGTPRDVAEAVAFLASDEARYITGHVLTVDGGISLGKL
jgi:3-oxoacyl-[acyl-carrier protein] reductase